MALGINTEAGAGGNFTPVVKINAKQGRVWRVDRAQGAEGWAQDEVDITNDFQFVPDFENMEVGWMHFAAGQAPSLSMVKHGGQIPAKPSDNHKQGVRLKIKLGKMSGGDLREIAATAKTILGPLDRLHDAYLAGLKDNPGKSPVVRMTSMKKIDTKTQHGTNTNFEPVFEIVNWVATPAEFTGGEPANEPVAEPVQQMKPTSQTAPEPDADKDDF